MISTILLAAALRIFAAASSAPAVRAFEGVYVARVDAIPPGLSRLEVWVPLPSDTDEQAIRNLRVESPYPGEIRREKEFGNAYWYVSTESPRPGPLEIVVRFDAQRSEVLRGRPRPATSGEAPATLQRLLRAEPLVTISPRIRALARSITYGSRRPEEKARAIYEYVVNTMTYDKVSPGWGNGDTERACDVRKGNCTDFHSLFISLVRAEGIPARFVIGFPLKKEAEATVPGYHCWAEFYLAGRGWIPVDASDASKTDDAARRDYLFGDLDPDRIQFTRGRNIRLDPPPCREPLNFFIYPYAEGDGLPIAPVSIRLEHRARIG